MPKARASLATPAGARAPCPVRSAGARAPSRVASAREPAGSPGGASAPAARAAAEPPLDAGFTQRLLACLEPVVGRPRHRRNWVIRISCGLAAAACLTLFIVSMGGPEPRVAGRVEANGTAPAPASAEEPQVAAGCLELEAAAVELQRTVEDAVVGTHESSASLVRLGTKTLQELIEVLELEDLRESDTTDIRTDGADAEEDADDVEDI